MPQKNNGIWSDRPAVQKAFDHDPQHAYNVVAATITPEQASTIEAALVPAPTRAEQIESLMAVKYTLTKNGVDTKAVDSRIAELSE